MRPAEISNEAIITAAQELQAAGRNITGFAIRQKVGGGNPTRLIQVWREYISAQNQAEAAPVAELPVEVAEVVAGVSKELTARLAALAVDLNDKTVKAAERRVAEVVRTAGEQREQAERELADAAGTVEELEAQLDAAQSLAHDLETRLTAANELSQAQAVELAQLRERLAQVEHTATRQAADLAKIEAGAAELRAELATTRQAKDEAAAAAVRTMEQLLTAQTERSAEAQRHTQEAANLRIAVEAGNARLEAAAREAEAAREQIKELRAEAKASASAQSQSKAK